jgi:hypothetical protein
VFNGTLDWPSPYRGQPNDDVDAAWDRISGNRTLLRMTTSTLALIDSSPNISNTYDPGRQGYNLESWLTGTAFNSQVP